MIRRWPPVTMFPAIAGVTQAFWYVLLGSEDDLKAGAECDIIRGIALSVCSHKIKGLKNTSTLFCLLLMRDDLQKCTEKRRFIWTRLLKPFFTTKKLDTSFEKAILSSIWAILSEHNGATCISNEVQWLLSQRTSPARPSEKKLFSRRFLTKLYLNLWSR